MKAFLFSLLVVPALLASCAQGSELDASVGGNGGAATVAITTTSTHTSTSTVTTSSTTSTTSTATSTSSTTTTTTTTSTSSSSSSGAGGGAGGETSGCATAPNDCATAVLIQSVDGDQNLDQRVFQGSSSMWLKVLVSEASNGLTDLSYTATLESPAGADYALFIYDGDMQAPNCSATPIPVPGDPPTRRDQWSDVPLQDDSKWITFEVRYISGTACSASDQWTLTVAGDTP